MTEVQANYGELQWETAPAIMKLKVGGRENGADWRLAMNGLQPKVCPDCGTPLTAEDFCPKCEIFRGEVTA